MGAHTVSVIRTVLGIIGNVISFGLFLSPVPTFKEIYKSKSTEKFHPYPYLAGLMNCMMWVFYGLPIVHPDSILVVTINGVGAVMEIIYLSFFFYYTNPKFRKHICGIIAVELIVFAAIVLSNLLAAHGTKLRTLDVGIICVVFNSIMYASPLSNMATVIKTKTSKYMPFWLCLVGFINGLIWFAYGFLKKFDPNLVAGNGFGSLCGAVQLIVYFIYRNGGDGITNNDVVKKPTPSNV